MKKLVSDLSIIKTKREGETAHEEFLANVLEMQLSLIGPAISHLHPEGQSIIDKSRGRIAIAPKKIIDSLTNSAAGLNPNLILDRNRQVTIGLHIGLFGIILLCDPVDIWGTIDSQEQEFLTERFINALDQTELEAITDQYYESVTALGEQETDFEDYLKHYFFYLFCSMILWHGLTHEIAHKFEDKRLPYDLREEKARAFSAELQKYYEEVLPGAKAFNSLKVYSQ